MRENRTSGSMRGRRKRAASRRACALLYSAPNSTTLLSCFSAGVNQTRSRAGIRSGQRMLKRFKAPLQFCTGMVHFFEAFRKAKYSSFMAASSFGNDPRILMILRSDMFEDSIVLVALPDGNQQPDSQA